MCARTKLSRGRRIAVLAATMAVVATAPARAEPGSVVVAGTGPGFVDWSRGLIVEVGAAAAGLSAPSPAVARVAAERAARSRAHAALHQQALTIVLADGTAVARAVADEVVAARLDRAVAAAIDLEVTYASDGSTMVTAALPLEALRLALVGAPAAPPRPSSGAPPPTAFIIDARAIAVAPALALEIVVEDEGYLGPTVFFSTLARARVDPRLAGRPARGRAISLAAGRLTVAGIDSAALVAGRRAGALVVVVVGE